jgi:hypothetical protein
VPLRAVQRAIEQPSALIYINSLPLGTQIMVEIYLGDGANLVEAIRLAPQNHRVGVFSSAAHCGMPLVVLAIHAKMS